MKSFEQIRDVVDRKNKKKNYNDEVYKEASKYLTKAVDNLKIKKRNVKKTLKNYVNSTLTRFNGSKAINIYEDRYNVIMNKFKQYENKKEPTMYTSRINIAVEKEEYIKRRGSELRNAETIIIKGKQYIYLNRNAWVTMNANWTRFWFNKYAFGKDETLDKFLDSIPDAMKPNLLKNNAFRSIEDIMSIFIDDVTEVENVNQEYLFDGNDRVIKNIKQIKAYAEDNTKISNQFIFYNVNDEAKTWDGLFKSVVNSEYVEKNYIPNACWITAVLNNWKNSHDRYYTSQPKLTYESVYKMITDNDYEEGSDTGITIDQMTTLFMKWKVAVYIYNNEGSLIYKYDPRDHNDKLNTNMFPKVSYFVFDGRHIHQVSEKAKHELSRYTDKNKIGVAAKPSDKMTVNNDEFESDVYIINTENDLIELIKNHKVEAENEYVRVLYQNSIHNLFSSMIDGGYKPKINLHGQDIQSIILLNITNKTGIFNVVVKSIISDHIQHLQFENKTEYDTFSNINNEFTKSFLKSAYKSSYSEQVKKMFNTYIRANAKWNYELDNLTCGGYSFDFGKYYPYCLMNVPEIPKFTLFDNFVDYDNHQIEDMTIYFIYSQRLNIYCDYNFNLVYGYNLKKYKKYNLKFTIKAYLRPYTTVKNTFAESIKKLCDNKTLDEATIKFIMNKTIGLTGKKKNKKQIVGIFENIIEATENQYMTEDLYGTKGELRQLIFSDRNQVESSINAKECNDDETQEVFDVITTINAIIPRVWVHTVELETELNEGFYPIQLFIYDNARFNLFELKKDLENAGGVVCAVNTDCVYINDVSNIDEIKAKLTKYKFKDNTKSIFENIGRLKCDKIEELPTWDYIKFKVLANIYKPVEYKTKQIELDDEWNKEEILNIINENNRLGIYANIAGAGKTTSLKQLDGSKTLFVCPLNTGVQDARRDGMHAVTYNILFGLHKDDNITFKGHDIDEYDNIVFDEIFLHDIERIQKIAKFSINNTDKNIYCTGDENQLQPINEAATKEYRVNAVNTIFNNFIRLTQNKRCKTKKDQQAIQTLTRRILNAKNKDEAINIIIAFFSKRNQVINNINEINTKYAICYYNATCDTVNRLIHKKAIKPEVGQVWVCRENINIKPMRGDKNPVKIRTFINYEYTIAAMSKTHIKISDGDTEQWLPFDLFDNKRFKIAYARTCHSLQGRSIDEKITICDIKAKYVNIEWLYTAITRTTRLENIIICNQEFIFDESNRLPEQVARKIETYKKTDIQANRDINDFITPNYVFHLLHESKFMCSHCNISLDMNGINQWSVNRLDNNKGHIKGNCEITCLKCNVTMK